ncbi:MAG: universal stress protein [Actinobacteria bacterium]|nr:MAG: universal stress protein [Actinomycetota bacterium]
MPLNPFRSEAEAYRFVWLTIGYFGLIVAGALINRWLGLAVFIVLSAIVLYFYFRRGERRTRVLAPTRARTPEDERRILVIANETVGGGTLRETIRRRSEGSRAEVLVVTPALNTPLKHWASDEDQARDAARERLDSSLARLKEAGIEARGEIGDGEPLQAIEDALRTFGADEIIISTHPEGRSNWLERGVVSGARERFAVPITHVVVDLERESEELQR